MALCNEWMNSDLFSNIKWDFSQVNSRTILLPFGGIYQLEFLTVEQLLDYIYIESMCLLILA